ncbi:hypothetical protein [Streptomyces sp. SM13]|uniref:hypothetical protein n=1 Tax=Streptomyces sp. SM13 TaxID=1983803 RepID=UPI000CD4D961|nr:hypothetical protein [Streptomyces sp. SM13]
MTTQPQRLHHLLDRLLRDVLLPEEREQLAELVRAQEARLNDWKQAAGAGMTLADNLRTEIHALALGVPLVCSDDRHKTQVLSQTIRIRELEAEVAHYEEVVVGDLNEANIGLQRQAARAEATVARVRQAVDAGPVGSCCAHLIHAALNPPTP